MKDGSGAICTGSQALQRAGGNPPGSVFRPHVCESPQQPLQPAQAVCIHKIYRQGGVADSRELREMAAQTDVIIPELAFDMAGLAAKGNKARPTSYGGKKISWTTGRNDISSFEIGGYDAIIVLPKNCFKNIKKKSGQLRNNS